jgi:hypothetical protein
MTCKLPYESFYPTNCLAYLGEKCEQCREIIPHLNLWLLGFLCFGLLLIVISILLIKYSGKKTHGK